MANQSGQLYGLTILSPIINNGTRAASQDLALRQHLSTLANGEHSPFARVPGTHFARLVVMNDVVFVGNPSKIDHLGSQYLIFTSDFDVTVDLDTYLRNMAQAIPAELDQIWKHCVGYPGAADPNKFAQYMKKCQVTTTFYFADVNDRTRDQTLKALKVKAELSAFVENNQGRPSGELQRAFRDFLARLNSTPPPAPGAPHV
ncbi:MAG: hypothetical protein WB780_14240 [Candidatus Acidiferrales bacterium]